MGRQNGTTTSITKHGSRMVHQNVVQSSMFSGVGSEYDATHLPQANDAAGRKEVTVSHGSSGLGARTETNKLAPKLDATKLEIEKLQLTLTQTEVTPKAMTSTMVALETR